MTDTLPATIDPAGALALPPGASDEDTRSPLGVFGRPRAKTGWRAWVSTVDHKKIGLLYIVTSFLFFLSGGIMALFG